jgi:photosystem II stability/assembly factor-like uncharacterized protein
MEIQLETSNINALAAAAHFAAGGPNSAGGGPIFAGTGETIQVSRDGGQTWQDALGDLRAGEETFITAMLYVPAPAPDGLAVAGSYGGVFCSTDAGATWQSALLASPRPVVTALAAFPDGLLLAGTGDDGVFLSHNGGSNWTRWNFGLLDMHIFALAAVEWRDPARADHAGERVIFAGTETGLFRSDNLGRSWHEVEFPMDAAPVLSLLVLDDETLLAGTETGALFRSTDRGVRWEPVAQELFSAEVSALVKTGSGLAAASGDQVWYSQDGASTWRAICQAEDGSSFLCLAGSADGELLAGTSSGKFYRLKMEEA